MQVSEIMTANPACCSPETSIQEAASMMNQHDCGEIPVVDQQNSPVGVITDRDICCRAVAQGKDPSQTTVSEVMTGPVITASPEDSLEDCAQLMEDNQIRRVPVVDEVGTCCGMVAQADIARATSEHIAAEVLRDISRPGQAQPGL